MQWRDVTRDDLPALAALGATLQQRPERHVVYVGVDAAEIEGELADMSFEAASVVAVDDDGEVAGWLVADVDEEMGRVWWIGPFVRADEWWSQADDLLERARGRLPAGVTEEEMAVDARFDGFEAWAVRHGFTRADGSWVLTLDEARRVAMRHDDVDDVDDIADDVACRAMVADDHPAVIRMHDELFPGTHTPGRALVNAHDPDHPRLVAVSGDDVVGYIAVEKQPGGNGYIDFVGVAPAHRRRGLGGRLVRAGVDALGAVGATPVHLTVRDDSDGARALYAALGFTEERLILPMRRGFELA